MKEKKSIKLKDVNLGKIVVSNKIKVRDEINKVFIGYVDDSVVAPLYLLLPRMSGYIKYFENSGKNMSFKIEDDEVFVKYNSIWNKIKELLGEIKLVSDVIYDDQYIKTKVKTFKMVETLFDGDKIPEEKIEYEPIPCISIVKVDKKWYP